ncbi:CehA/McbA family metallohydrolase [Sandaracinus amylolyticus]|uniref:CehA/McbA family metallohydrolase n=1 Tax=Sandaracinus amylolyticus TaxID=927083 RepID=UPI001EFF82F4|nr:CehA/McbA family metallohydrolase [Sandaracinus amylolyticus]
MVTLCGCGDDGPSGGDAGTDSGPPPTCGQVDPFETGDANGHADPLATAGQARAGRIEESELPEDRYGLATWAANDFVLANDRVAVIIEDAGPSDLYDPFGGRIVGVASREGDVLVPADFNEVLFGLGAYLVRTEAVTVMNDGSDGQPAVIRATGPLAPIDFAGDLLSGLVRGDVGGWPAAIDYELAPDSDRVRITIHAAESVAYDVNVSNVLQGFFQGSRMPPWTPVSGFDGFTGSTPFIAFDDPSGGASYAYEPPEGRTLRKIIEQSGVLVTTIGAQGVAACERVSVPLGSIAIGRSLDRTQAIAREALGEASRTIQGTVREADGSPATDVRVHVTSGETHHTRGRVDETGAFELSVPDVDVQVWAYRRGTPIAGPFAAPRGTDEVTLTMAAMGTIVVHARDEADAALPARVQLFPVGAEIARPAGTWGEQQVPGGRADVLFAGASGDVTVRVPAGQWRVVVSRGYEYELVDSTVTVAADATQTLDATLVRSVDTTGVLCADYHIHTTRSPDADDDADAKLSALVADGLELAVRSDHEFIASFAPVVTRLGLGAFVLGISGEELTTFQWGHFGVFPVEPDDTRPNGGAPRWPGRLPPEVFDEARALPGSPTFIVNHPRSGGAMMGYFNAVGYDPDTGMVDEPEMWDDDISVLEVLNDTSFEQNRDGVVRDWFSMLRFGRRVFAVGSSDSHHLYSAPVGYPRTCLEMGGDDPSAVTPTQVRDATAAGRSYVSGGIYLDVTAAGGVGPGGEVTGAGARASIDVVVSAATWIDVDSLEVIVDGVTVETIPITPAADRTETVVLDETIEVDVAATGSWVVIVAAGDEELEPVHPGRLPFAMTNPIFLTR